MRIITGRARGLQLTVPKTYDVRPTADRVKGGGRGRKGEEGEGKGEPGSE